MEQYILSFRTNLKTLLERQVVFNTLRAHFSDIKSLSIDMDDNQFILKVKTMQRNELAIQQLLLDHGHRISFLSYSLTNIMDQNSKIA